MITKITYYCDPETLGEMDLDAFRTHHPHKQLKRAHIDRTGWLEISDHAAV